MPPYKRMENRKYNQDEIKYVLSRAQAGWDDVTIARAFKKDHAKYWGNREFTKKQAAYIRSCYKMPYGSIKPYKGPMPVFSESPSLAAMSVPDMTAQQRVDQWVKSSSVAPFEDGAEPAAVDVAANYFPASAAQQQRPRAHGAVPVDPSLLQPDFDAGQQFFDFSGIGAVDSPNYDFIGEVAHGLIANEETGGSPDYIPGLDAIRDQLCEPMPDQSDMGFDTGVPSAYGVGSGMNNLGDDFGQHFNGSNAFDILAKAPDQSDDEQQQEASVNAGAQDSQSVLLTPPLQSIETPHRAAAAAAAAAAETQIPTGYTAEQAILRDPSGVWYYGPHDQCQIGRSHRHDTDGGVYFTSEMGVYQTFIEMRQQEGIGFLLGMATAQMVQGSGHPLDGWEGAAEIVRSTLPLEEEDKMQARVETPKPEITERLTRINRQLPLGHYYEPFTNRIVQYTLPPGSALGNGDQGNDNARRSSNQGRDPAGGPTQ